MAWDQNVMDDYVYALLNVAGVTGTVPNTRIVHMRVPPQEEPVYPLCRYQTWSRFRPQRVLNNGKSHYKGSYRVVGDFVDDPRGAKTFAAAVETAMTPASFPLVGGARQIIDCYPIEHIYDENDNAGDGKVYIMAGAIYGIEVEA